MNKLSRRVLLADNSSLLGVVLEQFGFDVVKAASGAEAVGIYEGDPSFDLVVLDIDMPGMNGFTASNLIRQYQIARRPYIIGTSNQASSKEKAAQSGIDLFVVKTGASV